MKSNFAPVTLFLSAALTLASVANAQEYDPDIAKALKDATRKPKDKITQITVTSPLPKPDVD